MARFEVERAEGLTAGEMIAQTGGQCDRPGVYLRVRNRSGSVAAFRAKVVSSLDPAEVERRVGRAIEDAWKRGGDPISDTSIRRILAR